MMFGDESSSSDDYDSDVSRDAPILSPQIKLPSVPDLDAYCQSGTGTPPESKNTPEKSEQIPPPNRSVGASQASSSPVVAFEFKSSPGLGLKRRRLTFTPEAMNCRVATREILQEETAHETRGSRVLLEEMEQGTVPDAYENRILPEKEVELETSSEACENRVLAGEEMELETSSETTENRDLAGEMAQETSPDAPKPRLSVEVKSEEESISDASTVVCSPIKDKVELKTVSEAISYLRVQHELRFPGEPKPHCQYGTEDESLSHDENASATGNQPVPDKVTLGFRDSGDGNKYKYVVTFQNSTEVAIVSSEEAKVKYPQLVLDYFTNVAYQGEEWRDDDLSSYSSSSSSSSSSSCSGSPSSSRSSSPSRSSGDESD